MIDAATVKILREEAMFASDEDRLPEAEARLSELIEGIGVPETPYLRIQLAECFIDRATVRRYANHWQEALDDLRRAEELAYNLKIFARGAILQNVFLTRAKILGTPIFPGNDYKMALEAIGELRKLGYISWSVNELESDLAYRTKDWQRAASLAEQVAKTLSQQGWQAAAMACRLRAGQAYLKLGRWQRAQTEISATMPFFEKYGPPYQLAAAQMVQALLLAADGDHDAAWEMANQALAGIESLFRHFRSLFDQQFFLLDKMEYYYQAFAVGFGKQGRQGLIRAWTVAERAKSFYLCQLMENAEISLFGGVEPSQLAHLRLLEQQQDEYEAKLGKIKRQLEQGPELEAESQMQLEAQQVEMEQKIQTCSMARRNLLADMMRANPRWAAFRVPPKFDLEAELKLLDPAWIPVSYFFQPNADGATLHVFYANADHEPRCISTIWSEEELEKLEESQRQMRLPKTERLRFRTLPFPDELVERVLPTDLVGILKPGRQLLVSPHDRLRGIPIHALPVRTAEPLIQHVPVQYMPTLALLLLHQPTTGPKKVLLMACEEDDFGDPTLEQVRSEIENLHQVWSTKRPGLVPPPYYIQKQSVPSESGIPLDEWKNFEFIHIACHGVFPAGRPLDAALRLGKEALRASELFGIRLHAKLVSLSACDLGAQAVHDAGVRLQGDEWIGMYLPLFYAGAQTLLVSLWEADSEKAAQFMETLHTALSEGVSPAEAFQSASISQSRKRPTLWANWYLVGYPSRSPS